MPNIGDNERKTQNRVIKFFKERLHYTYLGDLSDVDNTNIKRERLYAYLTEKAHYSDVVANKAIDELENVSRDMSQDLYTANFKVYELLKYGAKIAEYAGAPKQTVYFVDFEDISRNDFAVAEEVTVNGDHVKRPDVVIYVNGIALAVIELKRSTVSVSEGIRQNLTNQKAHFIRPFFTTIQYCMAGNDSEGLRYGTILTPEKYYLEWKQDGFTANMDEVDEHDLKITDVCKTLENTLDAQIYAMFNKNRFLDLIHNFIIFDKGRKKACRYNQYYGIKRAQHRIAKNANGIIWHTQGSGKSLTMVWLSKWLLANNPDNRVLIVTDREELDDQIEKLFLGVGENIIRTKSGKDLISKLGSLENRLICSLVHKFGKRGGEVSEDDVEKFAEEIFKNLPEGFSAKGRLIVFIDECHRTQSGKLNAAMKAIMPNAIFIGFTGTPLLKKDKKTSLEVFGSYIHSYKFDEAVEDGVVLDLRYEARNIEQNITSQDNIDAWFNAKTFGLSSRGKARLKQLWGTMQNVYSSKTRIEKIAKDIIFDFNIIPRLSDDCGGNAILVANRVYDACKYYEMFQSLGFKKCAVISSYTPQASELRTDTVSDDEDTETFEKYSIYRKMVGISEDASGDAVQAAVEAFEKEAKKKFIAQPANMKLLIVVDKLLTGFDAPPCTYLYIDKPMHDHGLFQAICRVNRLDGETKDFGYIVDYRELFGDLADAMNTYTAGAFEDYDLEDVEGLIKDRGAAAKKYFEDTLDELEELCEGVEMPREQADYYRYFCGENGVDTDADEAYARSREKLYRLVSRLLRAFAELKPRMDDVGYTSAQRAKFEEQVDFYVKLKEDIGRHSADFIDLKMYEPGMRYLIDNYIEAEDAKKIGVFDDFTLLDFILAQEQKLGDDNTDKQAKDSVAEAIENNIRKKVVQKITINPAYYNKMSEVLEQLILDRKRGTLAYKQLLNKYLELAKNVTKPEDNTKYPESIRGKSALRSLYDNCGENEQMALQLHKAVMKAKMDGFRGDLIKSRKVKQALFGILKDEDEVERVYNIVVEQEEY